MSTLTKAIDYAQKCDTETNHLYNGQPYMVHLSMVEDVALNFLLLIPETERENVQAACYTHDLIEDCRQTYNDVKQATNEIVAELTYALTNEKGKNRKERGNDKYYQGIRDTPNATFIKICDRIANVQYSYQSKSRMFDMYKKENEEFERRLYDKKYEPMFQHLREILSQTF